MNQFYKIENDYPIISPILLDGFIEYTVGAEPQELLDAQLSQALKDAEAEAKKAKLEALQAITVTTTSGKVFDGRDIDQQRMVSAIMSAGVVGMTETQWKLADNTVGTVTLDELKEALALSIQAIGNIIVGV
jgi:hypothetical protein